MDLIDWVGESCAPAAAIRSLTRWQHPSSHRHLSHDSTHTHTERREQENAKLRKRERQFLVQKRMVEAAWARVQRVQAMVRAFFRVGLGG